MRRTFQYAVSALVAGLLSLSAYAQRLDGTLRGTVEDPSGAVISQAEVIVTNQDTGVQQTTQTTSTGEYVFPNLLVGVYRVEARAKGFSTYSQKDVHVLPNQIVVANPRLVVGAENTIVEVSVDTEVVQTASAQLSNDFSGRAIMDIPNPGVGGGPLNFALMAPNTTSQGAGASGRAAPLAEPVLD